MQLPLIALFVPLLLGVTSAYRIRNQAVDPCPHLKTRYDVIKKGFSNFESVVTSNLDAYKNIFLKDADWTRTYACQMKRNLEEVKGILEDVQGGPGINGNAIRLKWISILTLAIQDFNVYCPRGRSLMQNPAIKTSIDGISEVAHETWSTQDKIQNLEYDSSCDDLAEKIGHFETKYDDLKTSYDSYSNKIAGGSSHRGRSCGGGCGMGGGRYPQGFGGGRYPPRGGVHQQAGFGFPGGYADQSGFPQYGAQQSVYPGFGGGFVPQQSVYTGGYLPQQSVYAGYPPQQPGFVGGYAQQQTGFAAGYPPQQGGGQTSIDKSLVNTAPSTQNVNGLVSIGLSNVAMDKSSLLGILG